MGDDLHTAYSMIAPEGTGVFFAHFMGSMLHSPVAVIYGERLVATAIAAEGDRVVVAYEEPNGTRKQVDVALSTTQGHSSTGTRPRRATSTRRQRRPSRSPDNTLAVSWVTRRADGQRRHARRSRRPSPMTDIRAAGRRLRALVADHDPIVRLLVVSVLAELGHETRACTNGADAWRTFEEWLPELVVLDADLPIVDGVEVCRRIREWDEKREVFVLFLTGRDHPEILDERARRRRRRVHRQADDRRSTCARGSIVSRRRMAQDAARRSAEEELSKARWLAGIGDATLALQHEINNPLSALLGNAELMIMELEEKGERNELLDVIHEQALRIADVVRRLRRLKNPESVDYVGGTRMINLWKEHAS